MSRGTLVCGETNIGVRTILERFVSLTYCMSYGKISPQEAEIHNRILVAVLYEGAFGGELHGIKDDVAKLCDWVEQGGGVLPFTDPQTWNDLRTVRNFFDIDNDMQPAFFYCQAPRIEWADEEQVSLT